MRGFFFTVLTLAALAGSAGVAVAASSPSVEPGRLYAVNGVKLYVELSGSGPPTVFLHGGLTFFDDAFAKQQAYFSSFRTVIGIDQRGHGHSPDNSQPFSYSQMTEDTAALLQALNLGRVDIVGHSDGGNIGLLLARYHPDLVRRLVISGANSRGDYYGLLAYLRFALSSTDRFAATLSPATRQRYAGVSPDGPQHWITVVGKTKELWATWTVLDPADLAAIQTPVLLIAGDHDSIPLEETLGIFRHLPHAQLCILPDTGHAPMEERPDEFNQMTRAFLETRND
jgi:pimeloyl-ACP methyl ester carboxylesterase